MRFMGILHRRRQFGQDACIFWLFGSGEFLRQARPFVTAPDIASLIRATAAAPTDLRSPHERSDMRGTSPDVASLIRARIATIIPSAANCARDMPPTGQAVAPG